MKPILFNTEMVRAILDGRKSVTRRAALPANDLRPFPREGYPEGWWYRGRAYRTWDDAVNGRQGVMSLSKYRPGDILYVRETWAVWSPTLGTIPKIFYKADGNAPQKIKWHPSIHMPKEAARIFLWVKDVRVERVQDIDDNGVVAEGMEIGDPFDELWDSTIRPADLPVYGWEANPWVWVIGFERISREEALGAGRGVAGGQA